MIAGNNQPVTGSGLEEKEARLRATVRAYGSCLVAFSGGVDSALVVAVAAQELGAAALAITGVSPSLPRAERIAAAAFAERLGARHLLLDTHELDVPGYAANPANRCYFCKSELYERLRAKAARDGFAVVADGTNHDDLAEPRHGRRAARERDVASPLADAGLTKADVRALARKLDLDVWDKPAAACLASRFPTGSAITLDLLERVENAERVLHAAGLRDCRVRHHGDLARIEVPPNDIARVASERRHLVAGIRRAGYRYVALDLAGYVRGGVATADPAIIDLLNAP